MEGFSGYNQIKMYPDDEEHTSFRTPLGCIAILWCPSNWKMWGRHIRELWIQSFTSIYAK